jgi:hypothetical protein
MTTRMWFKAVKYILFGAIFWIVGALFFGNSQGFIARSEPARLIVLQMDSRLDTDGFRTYRPIFGLDNAARPRPEYTGDIWMRPAPHAVGDIVPGRYDRDSGEMRSDSMLKGTKWAGRAAKIIGIVVMLQGVLMLFGIPELLLPLRVKAGR